MKLTKEIVAQLPLAEDRSRPDKIYFCDTMPGFGLRFRNSGKAAWVIQYRNSAGQTRRLKIGDLARLDVDKARQAAKRRFAEITLGNDPQASRAEAKAKVKLTLGAVADRYLEFKRTRVRISTYNAERRYLTQSWAPLRGFPIHTIARRQVAARLSELVREHGDTSAARARSALSSLFTWAMREGLVEANPTIATNNPAAGKRPRDRVLTFEEIRVLWQACLDDDFGRIIRLLILTGTRREEIGGLYWSEIDFERGTLTIPGTRTKNHRALTLPLPGLALSILETAPRRAGRELVFGARNAGSSPGPTKHSG